MRRCTNHPKVASKSCWLYRNESKWMIVCGCASGCLRTWIDTYWCINLACVCVCARARFCVCVCLCVDGCVEWGFVVYRRRCTIRSSTCSEKSWSSCKGKSKGLRCKYARRKKWRPAHSGGMSVSVKARVSNCDCKSARAWVSKCRSKIVKLSIQEW